MKTRRSSTSLAALIGGVAIIAGLAGAQPEPWVHPDGSIHYDHALSTPTGLNWNFAWDSALGHGGYLATITSRSRISREKLSAISSARLSPGTLSNP